MDVEMTMENCPITIPTVHTYKYLLAIMVYKIKKLYRVIHSFHVCL